MRFKPYTTAYKRYLIVRLLSGEGFHITRDGHYIHFAPTIAAAQSIIDYLTD